MGNGFAKSYRIVGLYGRWVGQKFSLDFSGQRYVIYGSLCIFPYFVGLNWLIQVWFDHMPHVPPSMLIC